MTEDTSIDRWKNYTIYVPYIIGFYRWGAFLLLKLIPALFYKQIERLPPGSSTPEKPIEDVCNKDVTVVVAVYEPPEGFRDTIESIYINQPFEILIVADITCAAAAREICKDFDPNIVKVIPEPRPGKRAALVTGIKHSRTKLTCLVDDDIIWCPTVIENMILPFQYPNIGGVGVRQNAFIRTKWDVFDILNNMRLAVRYLEIKATTVMDKGCVCISGRTACYRTSVVQCEDMYEKFLKEKFLCLSVLSGDDKFLTRYVINRGYKTYHQLLHNCELSTPFEKGERLFRQFIRWSRNTWRSDFNCMFVERKIWRNNFYTACVMFDKLFVPFFMMYGIVYTITLCFTHKSFIKVPGFPKGVDADKGTFDYPLFLAFIAWLFISRTIKLYYYIWEYPQHIVFIPLFILFQYAQTLIRLYALLTLYERGWGTRKVEVKGNEIVRSDGVAVEAPVEQQVVRSEAVTVQPEDVVVVVDPNKMCLEEFYRQPASPVTPKANN